VHPTKVKAKVALACSLVVVSAVGQQAAQTTRTEDERREARAIAEKLNRDRYAQLLAEAETGSLEAQHRLAAEYEYGDFIVKPDYGEALKWYRRAADKGYPPAQEAVGTFYSRGLATDRDDTVAAHWYRMAADQGDPRAQSLLGRAYLNSQHAWSIPFRTGIPTRPPIS
jgi:TPR repeat protein